MKNLVIACFVVFGANVAFADCDLFRMKMEESARALKQFDNEHSSPLIKESDDIRHELHYRTTRAKEIETEVTNHQKKIDSTEKEYAGVEEKIKSEQARADEFRKAGDIKKAQAIEKENETRKVGNAKRRTSIGNLNDEIVKLRAESSQIGNRVPPDSQLNQRLREIDASIAEIRGMREPYIQMKEFSETSFGLCQTRECEATAYQMLRASITALRADGCEAVLPYTNTCEQNGVADARAAFGCQ